MAGGTRRTQVQKEADRTVIGRLSLEGLNAIEIAGQMELSVDTVRRDLKVVQKEWRSKMEEERKSLLAVEIAKLDNMEKAAWDAWHKSKEARKVQTSTTEMAREAIARAIEENRAAKNGAVKTVLRSEGRDGNPVLLKLVFDCIRQRCLLHGLAPKDSIDSEVFERVEVEFEKLMKHMSQILPEEAKPVFFEAANAAVEALAALPAGK